jgi:hypothetical protein
LQAGHQAILVAIVTILPHGRNAAADRWNFDESSALPGSDCVMKITLLSLLIGMLLWWSYLGALGASKRQGDAGRPT